MGITTQKNHKNPRLEPTFDGKSDFNSLEPEAHVDPEAKNSTPHFDACKKYIDDHNLDGIRIRGLKYLSPGYHNDVLCKVEIVCENEKGICNVIKLFEGMKNKIKFTYVRIMGDNFINVSNADINVGQEGFMSLIELFAKGHMAYCTEFRFYNFKPEPTPLITFIDSSLVNNPTL